MTVDPALVAVPEELWQELRSRGIPRRFPRGATLFWEGEMNDRVYFLESGRVKISTFTRDGREVVLAIRGPGDLLGELSAIDGEPLSATGTALDPLEAAVIPKPGFVEFLEKHPDVALLLLRTLSRKLRDADRKRIEFGSQDTVSRLASRLIELADRYGETDADGVRISLQLSQEELAGWLGASREAVSRALRTLRERGWIETGRRSITLLDIESLRRRAT